MVSKALTYKIGMDIGELQRKAVLAGEVTRKQQNEFRQLAKQQQQHRKAMSDLGVGMLSFGAAAALGLGMAVRAAIQWESAFAGVRKTVDGSDEEIAALEGELRQLARTLPASHQEIAAVAEAAGQLGIKRKDVAAFTKTMIDLGETTNLTAEDAATALAKFSNIMGTSASDVDRLGAALVALGNDGASTEADIIAMGLRIAGAGKQIGMSEAQVLAFSSALSSVGIEAEAGGSSFSRVMIDMASSVQNNSDKLTTFAQVAGMSGAEFATAFRSNAAGAIDKFVVGLGRMQASGADVFGTLESLGFTEIRIRDTLLRAAGASDLFTHSLKVGSSAWAENTALTAEAEKRYRTTEAQLQVTVNNIKDAAIDIGAALLPTLQGGVDVVRNLVTFFQELPGPMKTVVSILGAVTTGVALLGGGALVAGPKILAFRESMAEMAASGGKASSALGKFGRFMVGPWGAAIAGGMVLLGALAARSGEAAQRQAEVAAQAKEVAEAMAEQGGAVDEAVVALQAKQLAESGSLQIAKDLGIEGGKVVDAVLGQGDAYKELVADLKEKAAIDGGQLNAEGQLLKMITERHDALQMQNQAVEDSKAATEDATGANKDHALSQEQIKKAAEEAAEALDKMADELDRLNGTTLSAREASRSYLESIQGVRDALKDGNKSLDINTKSGRENQEALDAQARAANDLAEAVSKEAEANGGAAAGASAMRASLEASRIELFNSARQFGLSEKAAWDYVDSVLAVPDNAVTEVSTPGAAAAKSELQAVFQKVKNIPPNKSVNVGVLSATAIKKLEQLGFKVRTLPNGSVSITANTSAAKKSLDNFIGRNYGRQIKIRVINSYENVVPQVGGRFFAAAGGVVHPYASGGMENHTPMVARAVPGTVRIWAEPETGTESYIPWAMDRRGRATDVLGITADAFGFALVPRSSIRPYAHGGVNGNAGSRWGAERINVQVFVGDREITDIVDVRVSERDRQTRRAVGQGAGRAR